MRCCLILLFLVPSALVLGADKKPSKLDWKDATVIAYGANRYTVQSGQTSSTTGTVNSVQSGAVATGTVHATTTTTSHNVLKTDRNFVLDAGDRVIEAGQTLVGTKVLQKLTGQKACKSVRVGPATYAMDGDRIHVDQGQGECLLYIRSVALKDAGQAATGAGSEKK
jgi:hypothetical protein